MLYFDMGPNNLFRLFRQGVLTAYEMGSKTGSEMIFGMLNEMLSVTAINLNGK